MESSALCRVCLASDRSVHRVADTPLQETYERVTRKKLVVKGRPCCVCSVCLSALRRCRRFIDTAHQANIALDRWSRNRSPRGKMNLTETPLFSLTQTVTEVIDHIPLCQQPLVKQKINDAANVDDQMLQQEQNDSIPDDEDNIITEEIKYEAIIDLDDEEFIHGSDDENTSVSDDENDNTQIYDKADSDETHNLTDDNDDNSQSNVECINKYDNEIFVDAKTEMLEDVEVLENVGDETAPGTSNVDRDCMSSDDENDNTQIYDNVDSDETHYSIDDDDNSQSNVEYINKYDNEIDVDAKTEILDVEVLGNVGDLETAPGISNGGRDEISSDDDMPLRSLRSQKRVNLTEDTNMKKMSPCKKRGESWSEDDLKAALRAVEKGKFSQRAIALKYKIPRRTLRDHVKTGQDVKRMGRKPLLSKAQEKDLCSRIKNCAKIGVPLSPKFIRKQVFMFCEGFGIKHNFDTTKRMAGADWLRNFLKRNPVT